MKTWKFSITKRCPCFRILESSILATRKKSNFLGDPKPSIPSASHEHGSRSSKVRAARHQREGPLQSR